MFNYTNPNIITPPAKCINGMKTDSTEKTICKNDLNLGCITDDMCGSSKCSIDNPSSIKPSLAMYKFIRPNDTISSNNFNDTISSGVNFINSDDISIISLNNQIPSNINTQFSPITMFSTSYNNIDTIYLVDKNNGLLALVNDLDNPTSNKTWLQILPSISFDVKGIIRTLTYAAFNGIFWVLLFNGFSSTSFFYSVLDFYRFFFIFEILFFII